MTAQVEAHTAVAAAWNGRHIGGERQEEEKIRSFDSIFLFSFFWLHPRLRDDGGIKKT
jgi:hypothetical protein